MSPWEKLLEHPHSRGHFVQLYRENETSLVHNVGRYFWEGLRQGDGVLAIVTADHRDLFRGYLTSLGADVPGAVESRQLVFCDAGETLAQFLKGGNPQWHGFERVVRDAMRQVRARGQSGGLRAYGEMVGVLWKERQFAAAIRLEQLWNKLLEQSSFSLYCSYELSVFEQGCGTRSLEALLCTHTHMVPGQADGRLDAALKRSMDEILGPRAEELRGKIRATHDSGWPVMPAAESVVLWLRKHLPEQADEIIRRARSYAGAG